MSVLQEASCLSNERWVNTLPDELEKIEFSKAHQRRMNALFSKMRGGKYHKLTKRALAALIAAIIAVSITVTAFAIPAVHEFIIEKFSDHSVFAVQNSRDTAVNGFEISYIPEGFELTEQGGNSEHYYEKYVNTKTNKFVLINQYSLNSDIWFNDEGFVETITKESIKIMHYSKGEDNGYLWNDDINVYMLNTNLDKEDALKIIMFIKNKRS